jgi:hypothetical protein
MCRWQNTTGTLLQLATTWIHEAQASRGGDCRPCVAPVADDRFRARDTAERTIGMATMRSSSAVHAVPSRRSTELPNLVVPSGAVCRVGIAFGHA